jgi:predicted DNA-binding WGR domain protein
MDHLLNEIKQSINNAVGEFSLNVASKFKIDINELEKLWNNSSKSSNSFDFKSIDSPMSTRSNISTKSFKSTSTTSGCPYKYIKGEKKGECCGSKPTTNKVFCSKHKKFEGSEQKEIKILPESKKSSITPSITHKKKSPVLQQRILRMNKNIGKLWHPETTFVFDSPKSRIVIGKCNNNTISDLESTDIDECRRWGFNFKEQKVIDDKEEDSDVEEKKEKKEESDDEEEEVKKEESDDEDEEVKKEESDDDDEEEEEVKKEKSNKEEVKKEESDEEDEDEDEVKKEESDDEEDEEELKKEESNKKKEESDEEDEDEDEVKKEESDDEEKEEVKKEESEDESEEEEEEESDNEDKSNEIKDYLVSGKKFWEITVIDTKCITRYGKIGKDGKIKEKNFSSNKEAVKHMESKRNIKVKKGYKNSVSEKVKMLDTTDTRDIKKLINELQITDDEEEEEEEKVNKYISQTLGLNK